MPNPTPQSIRPQDRRVFVRYPPQSGSPVLSVSGPDEILTWKAWFRDISVGGVCLILNGTFKPGAVIDVEFANPRTNAKRTVQAKVVRNETKDEVHWAVACTFLQQLTPDELKALTE